MPFVSAGDPDLDATAAILRAAQDAGASVCEIGVPFSDPIADGPVIQLAHVPAEIRTASEWASESDLGSLAGLSLDQIEKQAIRNTLRLTGGNREQAANLLGIGERTLYRKLKEFGLK